tara:strand:+ start:7680 stop:8309 length:630 start_codon:yes stop_codon:yes gene_type:complete
MAKLLHIETSPRKERSHSMEMAQVFLESYRTAHPTDEVETLDLWTAELPPFNGPTLDAKYSLINGLEHTKEQAEAWKGVVQMVNNFKSATTYLLSLPMWNFGIPYRLKHYIDIITQPGLTYSLDPEKGYEGMVRGRTISVIYARGGEYGKESTVEDMDFQKPYIETWLRFIGFADIRPVVIEPTMQGQNKIDLVKAFVRDHVQKIAREV